MNGGKEIVTEHVWRFARTWRVTNPCIVMRKALTGFRALNPCLIMMKGNLCLFMKKALKGLGGSQILVLLR
jgi:hypothetical protein